MHGLERLPGGPCVLVCNHGSYLDGMLLVAALPQPFAFVAKNELQRQFIAGTYLTRLGALFVERFDAMRSVADATRLAEAAAQGRSLAVFPEGTFVARLGLLPFHLGGFLAAARAAVPVVPVMLRGSRAILPGNTWWPRRAEIDIEIGEPLLPAGDAGDIFAMAVRLREAARRVIEQGLEGG